MSWSNLTKDQWERVQRSDHTTLFSREEVRVALRRLAPPEEVERLIAALYDQPSLEPVFFFGDLLTALSLGSPDAAERVRTVLNETEAQAEARIRQFLEGNRDRDSD